MISGCLSVRRTGRILALSAAIASILGAGNIIHAGERIHVRNALEVEVTPKGQKRLSNGVITPFLKSIGYDLGRWQAKKPDEDQPAEWKIESEKPFRLDDLPAEFREYKATFEQIASEISELPLIFHAPHPSVTVGDAWFESTPTRLGIENVNTTGAGYVSGDLVADFARFQVGAGSIRAHDRANAWLDSFELINPVLSGSELRFRVPFACRLKPGTREFEVRIGSIDNNFSAVQSGLEFERLKGPEIEFRRDGITEGKVELDSILRKHQEKLIGALKVYLERYARLSLFETLNPYLASKWNGLLDLQIPLDPPGTKQNEFYPPGEQFIYHFLPNRFEQDSRNGSLQVGWDFELIDELAPDADHSTGLKHGVRERADFGTLGSQGHDVGLAINPDIISHALETAIKGRGLLGPTRIDEEAEESETYRLLGAPTFHGVLRETDGSQSWKTSIDIGLKWKGWTSTLFFGREAQIHVTARIKPVLLGPRKIDFHVIGISLDESGVLDSSIKTRILKSMILSKAKKELRAKNAEITDEAISLYTFELEDEYLGLSFDVKGLKLDATGQLLLAMDLNTESKPSNPSAANGAGR
jgi:hypothetical protein